MQSFSARDRTKILEQCQKEPLDIIIVGGGITGAGALLEATKQGYKAALFEQNDFASATSSSSSKLIHGGLRYLEMMDFGLIFESCKLQQVSRIHIRRCFYHNGLFNIHTKQLLFHELELLMKNNDNY